jgi:hypothetical protein
MKFRRTESIPATARLELERIKCWKSSLSGTRPDWTWKKVVIARVAL